VFSFINIFKKGVNKMKLSKGTSKRFFVLLTCTVFILSILPNDMCYSYSDRRASGKYSIMAPGYINAAMYKTKSIVDINKPTKKPGFWEKFKRDVSKTFSRRDVRVSKWRTNRVMLNLKRKSSEVCQKQQTAKTPKTTANTVQNNVKTIKLPQKLADFLKNKPILNKITYKVLGLTNGEKIQDQYNSKNQLVGLKDVKGALLLTISYAANGHIGMICDIANKIAVEYATSNTHTYYETLVKETDRCDYAGPIKYIYERKKHTATNVLGKVLNTYMTDTSGNILKGEDIETRATIKDYWGRWCDVKNYGFYYFADKSPLVPYKSGPIPYVAYHGGCWYHPNYRLKAAVQEYRYGVNGSIKSVRYNAWTAGQSRGFTQPGRYAYRIDTYNKCGRKTINWYNDPAPTRFEPTFTGKVVKDQYNNLFLAVKKGIDNNGSNITKEYKGRSFLLTTRYTDTTSSNHGGQPGHNQWQEQRLETAYEGGAGLFTSLDWDKLIGRQITVQGHLMSNPAVSEKGLHLNGRKAGVFSVFDVIKSRK